MGTSSLGQESCGLDNLLEMFAAGREDDFVAETGYETVDEESKSPLRLSQLTPKRASISNDITANILEDEEKLSCIEKFCPNWKENIKYGLSKTCPVEIKDAIRNVEIQRSKIKCAKENILTQLQNQDMVLELYVRVLMASLERQLELKREQTKHDGLE